MDHIQKVKAFFPTEVGNSGMQMVNLEFQTSKRLPIKTSFQTGP